MKINIIELESHLRPFQKEAERIQSIISRVGLEEYRANAERLLEERRASGVCLSCGKGLRGGGCEECAPAELVK